MKFRAGMFVYALAFLLGVVTVQQLTVLPDDSWLRIFSFVCSGIVLLLLFSYRSNRVNTYEYRLILSIIILIINGFIYSSFYAQRQLAYQLEDTFMGKDLLLSGYVSNIPSSEQQIQRFEFTVTAYQQLQSNSIDESHDAVNLATSLEHRFPRKVRLSWYYGEVVSAADHWQLEVRLKPPHGFSNPGGFDYEGWLLQQNLDASGYVRKSSLNQKQLHGDTTDDSFGYLLARVSAVRQRLSQFIDSATEHNSTSLNTSTDAFTMIKALAIGDKSSITSKQWQVMIATGTSHLMAISGLHIGLAAFFVYLMIRPLIPTKMIKQLPAQQLATIAGLIVATMYALMAGFSVPTQRALIMLFVLSGMMFLRRNNRPYDALGFAMLVVLLFDPMAVISAGFWFSFSAVAVIFLSVTNDRTIIAGIDTPRADAADTVPDNSLKRPDSRPGYGFISGSDLLPTNFTTQLLVRSVSVIRRWIRLQLLISLFLLPLSLYLFQQVSLISPLANLLLIPYMSFLVVPLVLLALSVYILSPQISGYLFELAAMLLDFIWPILRWLSELPVALWVHGGVGFSVLLSAVAALLLFYFSKAISRAISRQLGTRSVLCQHHICNRVAVMMVAVILLLPLLLPAYITQDPSLDAGDFDLTVLDVGQGSAAVLRTQHHALLFDTGARFSDRLSAGSNVIIPFLRSQGISMLDTVVISHGDADHIGGAQAVLEAFPETRVTGQEIESLHTLNKKPCTAGNAWQWDEIEFEFLSGGKVPSLAGPGSVSSNNQSCVLKVTSASGSVLFTGDIEKQTELALLQHYPDRLRSDVLLVPHHGSKTSSSPSFIAAVKPKISIVSVGYRNRYRLPNNQVLSRYEALNTELWRTDLNGAVSVQLRSMNAIQAAGNRQQARRYWTHQPE